MKHLEITTTPEVQSVFDNYPDTVKPAMLYLRQVILESAEEMETLGHIEETLKWGEPSYVTKSGSTLRIDWKPKAPDQYAMYFQCTSRLVSTFKSLFKNVFFFEGNRAIVFNLNSKIPVEQLKLCIKATLAYHKVKHLPTLGI